MLGGFYVIDKVSAGILVDLRFTSVLPHW